MAKQYVVVTVPSKPDDNPEHIHLLQINLFEQYGASVRIVYLEKDWQTNLEQNRNRDAAVPESALDKMLSILEPPMPWEARTVEWK